MGKIELKIRRPDNGKTITEKFSGTKGQASFYRRYKTREAGSQKEARHLGGWSARVTKVKYTA